MKSHSEISQALELLQEDDGVRAASAVGEGVVGGGAQTGGYNNVRRQPSQIRLRRLD